MLYKCHAITIINYIVNHNKNENNLKTFLKNSYLIILALLSLSFLLNKKECIFWLKNRVETALSDYTKERIYNPGVWMI